MSDILTNVNLPTTVPFPVTVTSILCNKGEVVGKHKPLLKYKYWDYEDIIQDDPNVVDVPKRRVERIGTLESPIEGEITRINTRVGEEIAHAGVDVLAIQEPCSHAVQYGGLCALCGKQLDEVDYSGYNYEDRAPIAMSHGTTGLKVSYDEAEKLEQDSTERLAAEKKLILVVDLDQTVIHATVDPTVGEWKKDPSNPNYPSVKDVQSFSLEEEAILPPHYSGPKPPPQVCWYYVKLRPGLNEFLEKISKLYELHIYTMATRAYAVSVAKIIDPEAKYFGDRILSRDESGSLTQKSLQRLFPVDQSMVVVIDDRGDVWNWSSNLVKVIPYDFFVGIGDINSSFLPRQTALLGPSKRRKSVAMLEEAQVNGEEAIEKLKNEASLRDAENAIDEDEDEDEEEKEEQTEEPQDVTMNDVTEDIPTSPVDRIIALGGGEDNADLLAAQASERNASIEAQQTERPLAKLQKDLEEILDKQEKTNGDGETKNLLFDDDTELESLEIALSKVHEEFYRIRKDLTSITPDIKTIMPHMKMQVLKGVTILFSGVLARGTRLDAADIVIWARSFGATVVGEVFDTVTHVITRNPGTFKVRVATATLTNVKIVNPDWLFQCIRYWMRVEEDDYLIDTSKEHSVDLKEIEKYHRTIYKNFSNAPKAERKASVTEGYDWNEADKEVDDFLASDSSDDDDDKDDGADKEASAPADDDDIYGDGEISGDDKKRTREDEVEDKQPSFDRSFKKHKSDDEDEDEHVDEDGDLGIELDDELEKELMLGFEDLEDIE